MSFTPIPVLHETGNMHLVSLPPGGGSIWTDGTTYVRHDHPRRGCCEVLTREQAEALAGRPLEES